MPERVNEDNTVEEQEADFEVLSVFAEHEVSPHQAVPLRRAFVQTESDGQARPGQLSSFVSDKDDLALSLYLLLLTLARTLPSQSVALPSFRWASLLRRGSAKGTRDLVSRAWRRLERRSLVELEREGRLTRVTLLREDGSGKLYRHPGKTDELYFKLPVEYWTQGHHASLTLPGRAMLLVALSLGDEFVLPAVQVPRWYGVSADTARRGLKQLVEVDLLGFSTSRKKAPESPGGFTFQRYYTLRPPMGPHSHPSSASERREDDDWIAPLPSIVPGPAEK